MITRSSDTPGFASALTEQIIYILAHMSSCCVDYPVPVTIFQALATKSHLSYCRSCVYTQALYLPKKSKSTEPRTQSVYRLPMTPVLCAVAKDSSAEQIKIKTSTARSSPKSSPSRVCPLIQNPGVKREKESLAIAKAYQIQD